ncbi:hypothetical protein [Sphingomonas tagetis]|nr:hypothetical protein [Sphingomonas tagetis]
MTGRYGRYILTEATVSAVINAVLSILFVVALFLGEREVAVRALIADALPQSFMVALMAALVPTLLTQRRLRRGSIPGAPRFLPPRRHPLVGALLTALGVTAVAFVAHRLLLPALLPATLPFATLLAGKAVYGALLGAGVTAFALRRLFAGDGAPLKI